MILLSSSSLLFLYKIPDFVTRNGGNDPHSTILYSATHLNILYINLFMYGLVDDNAMDSLRGHGAQIFSAMQKLSQIAKIFRLHLKKTC